MNKHQTIVTLLSHEWVLRQQIYDPERWPLSVGYRANISWGWRYAVAENFRINMELARRSFGRVLVLTLPRVNRSFQLSAGTTSESQVAHNTSERSVLQCRIDLAVESTKATRDVFRRRLWNTWHSIHRTTRRKCSDSSPCG